MLEVDDKSWELWTINSVHEAHHGLSCVCNMSLDCEGIGAECKTVEDNGEGQVRVHARLARSAEGQT